jgi:pimeloyl-ACP methyl ester carboxylesterase
MDVSASWQFLVDALGSQWRFVAPDWRGFGQSEWVRDGIYSYTDYVADLDALVRAVESTHAGQAGEAGEVGQPGRPAPVAQPVRLIGHSLGGNIASLYAAARNDRVSCLVNLEGFGLRRRAAREAPVHLRNWLDDLDRFTQRREFADRSALESRVRAVSHRISAERAAFVADHWGEQGDDGRWRLRADPAHLRAGPDLWRLDEAMACWREIKAPALWVEAAQSENIERHRLTPATLDRRRRAWSDVRLERIDQAGHMLHWEHPERLAALISPFLRATDPSVPRPTPRA